MKHFRRGQSTFNCGCCGRLTRDTGDNGSVELCPECYELGGEDNMHNDDGTIPTPRQQARYDALIQYIVKRGGDGDRAMRSNEYLFRK